MWKRLLGWAIGYARDTAVSTLLGTATVTGIVTIVASCLALAAWPLTLGLATIAVGLAGAGFWRLHSHGTPSAPALPPPPGQKLTAPIDLDAMDRLEHLAADCDWSMFAISPSERERLMHAVYELEQFLNRNGSRFDYDTMVLATIFARSIREGLIAGDLGVMQGDLRTVQRGFASAETARGDVIRRLRELRAELAER